MSLNAPVGRPDAGDRDPGVGLAERDVKSLRSSYDEDVPARRLLAHDLEHIVWDEDGDTPVPPPD